MKDAIKGIFSRMIGSPKTLSPASSKQDLRQSPTKSLSGGQLLSLPTKGLIFGRKLTELPSDDDHIPFILKDFVEYIENKSGGMLAPFRILRCVAAFVKTDFWFM